MQTTLPLIGGVVLGSRGSYLLIMTGAPLCPEGFAAPLVLADRLAGWVEDAKIFPSLWPVIDWVTRPLT